MNVDFPAGDPAAESPVRPACPILVSASPFLFAARGREDGPVHRALEAVVDPKESTNEDERAIRAILAEREEALARGDAAAASSSYAEEVVQFDLAPPLRLRGADVHDPQVLQRWLDTWEGNRVEARLSDLTVTVGGDLGAAWGLLRLRGVSKQGTVVDEWSRSTVVFGRRQGAWRIIHEHGSYPLRMDGSGQAATDLEPWRLPGEPRPDPSVRSAARMVRRRTPGPSPSGHTLSDEVLLMNRALRRVLLAAAAAASACSSYEAPPDSRGETTGGFQTSRLHYDFGRVADGIEASIPYVYRNVTGDSVYFVNCNAIIVPSLEKRTGDTWSPVWSGATPACLSPPVVVPPDGEYTDTVRVLSGPNMYPQLRVADIEGTYRLVWHGVVHSYHGDAPGFGTALPREERTSNEFTLSPPPR